MMDVGDVVLTDETPDADAVEQHLIADYDDETGLDAGQMESAHDRDASEADLLDQATVVALPHDALSG
ncbi:MAG: hypothetical protein JOZ23_04390 [Mycobacterium sp.]|nr:hypothetical protein [Mycobacterium sp.]